MDAMNDSQPSSPKRFSVPYFFARKLSNVTAFMMFFQIHLRCSGSSSHAPGISNLCRNQSSWCVAVGPKGYSVSLMSDKLWLHFGKEAFIYIYISKSEIINHVPLGFAIVRTSCLKTVSPKTAPIDSSVKIAAKAVSFFSSKYTLFTQNSL